jgi:predicted O-methyltransferase YrrM
LNPRDLARLVAGSSVGVAKYARFRLACDVLVWPFRDELASIWQVVDQIPGWLREPNAIAMYGAIRAEPPRLIVEIGSYLGRSTVFFALCMRQLNPSGRVVAIDPHTGDRQQLEALGVDQIPSFELFKQHCRAAGVEPWVDARRRTSLEAAEGWSEPVDLLYVDGWHSYDAVLGDGRAWLPHLAEHGVVFFDDYGNYGDVRNAVGQLAAEGSFHLWGTVFRQAVGGRQPTPPDAIKRALRAANPTLTVRRP